MSIDEDRMAVPKDVGDKCCQQSNSQPHEKQAAKAKDDRDDIFQSITQSMAQSVANSATKNDAIAHSAISMSHMHAQQGLDTSKKKNVLANLKGHLLTQGDNARAQKIDKTVKKKCDPDEDDNAPLCSQSTTGVCNIGSFDTVCNHAADILDADKEIALQQNQFCHVRNNKNDFCPHNCAATSV